MDILFIAFLGERELEELLPEDEAERERLLQDTDISIFKMYSQLRKDGPTSSVGSLVVTNII